MLLSNDIPTQPLSFPLLLDKEVSVSVLRLDLVHPDLSGNKFFKLRHNFLAAQNAGIRQILTFGGAFSNHIYATAAAGALYKMKTIGVIRGEIIRPLNPTLRAAEEYGMKLYAMKRSIYRQKEESEILDILTDMFGQCYIIPEGGTNELAIKGCEEILSSKQDSATHIAISMGTGGTIAGIISSALPSQTILGFSVLKGEFMINSVQKLLERHGIIPSCPIHIFTNYHFGGYAKHTPELISFMRDFFRNTGIPLDPIYTGKMVYGIFDLIQQDYFPPKSEIIVIHSGGIQGIKGFEERWGFSLYS